MRHSLTVVRHPDDVLTSHWRTHYTVKGYRLQATSWVQFWSHFTRHYRSFWPGNFCVNRVNIGNVTPLKLKAMASADSNTPCSPILLLSTSVGCSLHNAICPLIPLCPFSVSLIRACQQWRIIRSEAPVGHLYAVASSPWPLLPAFNFKYHRNV